MLTVEPVVTTWRLWIFHAKP